MKPSRGGFIYKERGIHTCGPINLQDAILREAKEEKIPIDLVLTGGYQIGGVITGYDSFVVVLVSDGKQYMIYKHGILTMTAIRPMKAATP